MSQFSPQFTSVSGREIAYRREYVSARDKGVFWIGGFASEMDGTKACFLAEWAAREQVNLLRFDYSGCGLSRGDFYQGRLSYWREEAEAVFERFAEGRQLVVASSMGAWIALHCAARFPEKIAGMIFVAPAPDFTHKLLSEKFRAKVIALGRLGMDHPSGPLSRLLIEDAATQLVMGSPIKLAFPVHMMLGLCDDVVPLSHVLELVALLDAPDVALTLIKNGDHRLSEPAHLQQLQQLVAQFYQTI